MIFPFQKDCDVFYGNPRNGAVVNKTWYGKNITTVSPPFKMMMGDIKITRIPVHVKCAETFSKWLYAVWANSGRSQNTIDTWGISVFSGSFNYRPMRGIQTLSMHAYGCAIDFDAPRNALGDKTPNFAKYKKEIVQPFLDLGGVWGGTWARADGMHFQLARV